MMLLTSTHSRQAPAPPDIRPKPPESPEPPKTKLLLKWEVIDGKLQSHWIIE